MPGGSHRILSHIASRCVRRRVVSSPRGPEAPISAAPSGPLGDSPIAVVRDRGHNLHAYIRDDVVPRRTGPTIRDPTSATRAIDHAVPDLAAYQRLWDEQLSALPGVRRVESTLVMKTIVDDRPLPI